MGRRLAGGRGGRLLPLLLQHDPDAGGRHPRSRPAQRVDPRHQGLCRADRQPPHRPGDRRRCRHRHRDAAFRFSAQPAIPGPDQGAASLGRGDAARRGRGARPLRPLAQRRPGDEPGAARPHRRAGRGAATAAPAARNVAQERHAQIAPAREARRLHARQRRRNRGLSRRGRQRRRLGQAGARPRDPGNPAVARQDPQCRQRVGRQDAGQPGIERHRAGARLRHRLSLPRRGAALRAGHHHDRRRCRRRPYRLAADDVLLPRDVEAGRQRTPVPGAAAALPADPGRGDALCPRRRASRGIVANRVQRPRQGRDQPLQGTRRDAGALSPGDDDGSGAAHLAAGEVAGARRPGGARKRR